MNIKKVVVYFISLGLINSWFAVAQAEIPSTDKAADLPPVVGNREINADVREEVNRLSSSDLRIKYLFTVVSDSTNTLSVTNNFKKASAIRLLGVMANTNAINILVSNIAFEDIKYHDNPAVEALVSIGEPAVFQLLEVVKEPLGNSRRVPCAVEALMKIKGDRYNEFVQGQKNIMSSEIWKRLLEYAVVD